MTNHPNRTCKAERPSASHQDEIGTVVEIGKDKFLATRNKDTFGGLRGTIIGIGGDCGGIKYMVEFADGPVKYDGETWSAFAFRNYQLAVISRKGDSASVHA